MIVKKKLRNCFQFCLKSRLKLLNFDVINVFQIKTHAYLQVIYLQLGLYLIQSSNFTFCLLEIVRMIFDVAIKI